MSASSKPLIALCLPTSDLFHPNTVISILNGNIPRPGIAINARGKNVFQARNELVRDALAFEDPELGKVTHLLWIDDDMVFRGDAVPRLIAHDLPIVGGLCYNRHHPYNPVMLYEPPKGCESVGYLFRYEWPQPPGLLEVDATGAAFLLTKREVFEKIAENLKPDEGPFTQGGWGEDVSFCRRARAAGYKVMVDTSIEIGHVGEVVVAEAFATRNRQGKLNPWTETIGVTKCGLRILGDEDTPDGHMHRARYRWASDQLKAILDEPHAYGLGRGEPENMRVLDYGCGTGHGTDLLRTTGFDAIGYDPDKEAIEWGRAKFFNGSTRQIDWDPVYLQPGYRWDAIVAFEVIEHLPEHPSTTLARLLSMAPIVIGSVPFREPAGFNPHHRHSNLDWRSLGFPDPYPALFSIHGQKWNGEIGTLTIREETPIMLFIARRRS